MSERRRLPKFAPLPLRALRDSRLGKLHLCTLGIVAAFDRLGKTAAVAGPRKTK